MQPSATIVFCPAAKWPRHAEQPLLLLEAANRKAGDSLAELALREGGEGFVCTGTGRAAIVYAPETPVFDDLVALWLLTKNDPMSPENSFAVALCNYAKLCRQGLTPGSAPVDQSPRCIFEEIRRSGVELADDEGAAEFVKRSFALFSLLERRVASGADLFGANLFENTSEFQQEISLLRGDRAVYLEDRQRGSQYCASLPQGTQTREVDLLVLEEPMSNRFADWARQDPESPSGTGFALMLVRWPNNSWVLSADPAKRMKIGWLAEALELAEQKKAPLSADTATHDAWYAGDRHNGTLVAAPKRGTALDREELLDVLKAELRLNIASSTPLSKGAVSSVSRIPRAAAAMCVGAMLVLGTVWVVDKKPTEESTWTTNRVEGLRGAKLVAPPGAAEGDEFLLYRNTYAIIIGINDYEESSFSLKYAVQDAQAMAALLEERYGFVAEQTADQTLFALYDEQATKDGILDVFQEVKKRASKDDSLLVFWAGHGTHEASPSAEDFGYLVPHDGTMGQEALKRNVTMRSLKEDWVGLIKAKHKLIIVDACFGGLLTRAAGNATDKDLSYLQGIAGKEGLSIFTAGAADEEVLDEGFGGHSVFASHLLRVLTEVKDYATVSEIAPAIRELVFRDAKAKGHRQTPNFRQMQGEGDYIFVPRSRASESLPR